MISCAVAMRFWRVLPPFKKSGSSDHRPVGGAAGAAFAILLR
jgi:hypothetical protein